VSAVSRAAPPTTVDGSTLRYPKWQAASELDKPNFDSADALIRSGAALQNLLTLNNVVSGTVTDEALGTTSYSARTKPIINRASADQSRTWINDRLRQVSVAGPRAVTLSSSSGRFQATITNDLDQPVTVALDAKADGKLTIDGPRRVEVAANNRQAVLLTARTDENGIHQVTLFLTDKRGTPLGGTTGLTIRSAQVSNVIWLFLATGLALLFGAIGVRLFRRIRNARRTPTESESGPDDGPDDGPETTEQKEPAGAGTR
jgi:DNA-directed RNA polymerase subunit K/omega